jgi:predicted phosphodiesterase
MTLPIIIPKEDVDLVLRYHREFPYMRGSDLARVIVNKEQMVRSIDNYRKVVMKVLRDNQVREAEHSDYELPESSYEEYESYVISPSCNKILVLSDVHIPYQDNKSLRLALDYGMAMGANCIILNGDTIDCYQASRFVRNPSVDDLTAEIERAIQFFQLLRKLFPNSEIIHKTGNHEDRWKHLLFNQAPALSMFRDMQLDNILKLDDYDIKFVDDKRKIEAGKLFIIHGHEMPASSMTVNVARVIRLKANDNVLLGHFHRSNDDFARTISNKVIGAWSTGCLCGLSPLYMPNNNWNHGFAFVETSNDGMFEVHNKKIIGGVVK